LIGQSHDIARRFAGRNVLSFSKNGGGESVMEKRMAAMPQLSMPVRMLYALIGVGLFVDRMLWSRHSPLQFAIACFGSLTFLFIAINNGRRPWLQRLFVVIAAIYAVLVLFALSTHWLR
jgi:hypothetical protein